MDNANENGKKVPAVGMPATYVIGSDNYAGTISYVSPSGAFVLFVKPGWTRSDQFLRFNRSAKGRYQTAGGRSGYLHLGTARDYRDPSF